MSHRGRVLVRKNAEGGVTVLCPYGHLVTAWRPGDGIWAGSALEARVASAAHGKWVVDCDGALPSQPQVEYPEQENTMIRKWDDYRPDEQQKLRTYMDTSTAGGQLKAMATTNGELNLDYAVWLLTVDTLCGRKLDGLSMLDLADFCWRDAFDNEVTPAQALADALRAEGMTA